MRRNVLEIGTQDEMIADRGYCRTMLIYDENEVVELGIEGNQQDSLDEEKSSLRCSSISSLEHTLR